MDLNGSVPTSPVFADPANALLTAAWSHVGVGDNSPCCESHHLPPPPITPHAAAEKLIVGLSSSVVFFQSIGNMTHTLCWRGTLQPLDTQLTPYIPLFL